MPPLRLSDAELDAVFAACRPLDPDDRGPYLERIAEMLGACCEIGDGAVGRAVALAQARYFRPPNLQRAAGSSNVDWPRSFIYALPHGSA